MREFVERLPPELQKAWHETVGESYRQRAAKRAIVEKECAVCGSPFTGIKKRQYCSGRCRQVAHRQRHTPAPPAAPPGEEAST